MHSCFFSLFPACASCLRSINNRWIALGFMTIICLVFREVISFLHVLFAFLLYFILPCVLPSSSSSFFIVCVCALKENLLVLFLILFEMKIINYKRLHFTQISRLVVCFIVSHSLIQWMLLFIRQYYHCHKQSFTLSPAFPSLRHSFHLCRVVWGRSRVEVHFRGL